MIHKIPIGQTMISGDKVKPGHSVVLSGTYTNLFFKNLQSVKITNDGPVTVQSGLKFDNCKQWGLVGSGKDPLQISAPQPDAMGINIYNRSTDFEVAFVEIFNTGFAGLMGKSDPTTDEAMRGNFTMANCSIHDNYIHDTKGEGIYLGNSFYVNGVMTNGKLRYPHDVVNLRVYNNRVVNTGWEAIQVGCGVTGTMVYDNIVENYGTANRPQQNNGLQLGEGTGGLCFRNKIRKGTGNGMIVLGVDNIVFENDIIDAGEHGIYCAKRMEGGVGFKFIRNVVANPGGEYLKSGIGTIILTDQNIFFRK